jgi:hypothetical protein
MWLKQGRAAILAHSRQMSCSWRANWGRGPVLDRGAEDRQTARPRAGVREGDTLSGLVVKWWLLRRT